jgi:anti-sigma factor RsiW
MTQPIPLSDADREELIAYLDGELDAAASRRVESRMALDPGWRSEADALRRTWALLDRLPRPRPSAAFTSTTLERITVLRPGLAAKKREWYRRPWAVGAGWAAAVLVAGTVGFGGMTVFRPRPAAPHSPLAITAIDPELVRDLRVVENQRLYQFADDIRFVRALDDPELFGDDGP